MMINMANTCQLGENFYERLENGKYRQIFLFEEKDPVAVVCPVVTKRLDKIFGVAK
jgi:hypothetical protein